MNSAKSRLATSQTTTNKMKNIFSVFTNKALVNRVKALAWSCFWVAIAAVADHSLANLGMLHLPNVEVLGQTFDSAIILGLILNQVSKHAHNVKVGKA